jgi:hypothetical protein
MITGGSTFAATNIDLLTDSTADFFPDLPLGNSVVAGSLPGLT